jgi:hypothetical protein
MTTFQMDWPYLTLNDKGQLVEDDGTIAGDFPIFASRDQAEQYLIDNDIRGTVR